MVVEKEFEKLEKEGKVEDVKVEESSTDDSLKKDSDFDINEYIIALEALKRIKMSESEVPTYPPKKFMDQIYLYQSGSDYRTYLYIKDAWKKIYDSSGLAPAGHKISHQNGGSDEINVGGLSGLLADEQNPTVHALSFHSIPTASIDMDGQRLFNVQDPTASGHVATWDFVKATTITSKNGSAQLTYNGTAGDTVKTIAHGLGATPKKITFYIDNNILDAGFPGATNFAVGFWGPSGQASFTGKVNTIIRSTSNVGSMTSAVATRTITVTVDATNMIFTLDSAPPGGTNHVFFVTWAAEI